MTLITGRLENAEIRSLPPLESGQREWGQKLLYPNLPPGTGFLGQHTLPCGQPWSISPPPGSASPKTGLLEEVLKDMRSCQQLGGVGQSPTWILRGSCGQEGKRGNERLESPSEFPFPLGCVHTRMHTHTHMNIYVHSTLIKALRTLMGGNRNVKS